MATKAEIKFVGDSSVAVTAVRRLKTEMGELQSLAAKSLSFGGLLTGGAAVTGLVAITQRAVDAGDAFFKMSQKTGVAVEDLSKLIYAADLSGVSVDVLQKGMTSMATGMTEASLGSGIAGEAIKKLGINVKNADGSMRSSMDVLYDLADMFSAMPAGVEKTNFAVDIFGKKLGADMIPLLNQGSAGLRGMADEAERLGLVMSTDLAKKSEEFNDNLARLAKLSEAAGISIAGRLVPALNDLLERLLDSRREGANMLAWLSKLSFSNPILSSATKMLSLREDAKVAEIKESEESVRRAAKQTTERALLETKFHNEYIRLLLLRAVQSGKVSADILLDDGKRTDAQIKNAEKLRDTLTGLWDQSLKSAKAAGDEAEKLLAKAADTRVSGADKAADLRRSTLSPEDQQAQIGAEFEKLAGSAIQAASLAKLASMQKRTENAAKLTAQAERDAERAVKLADQISDPEEAARAVERLTEIQASLLEQQAAAKKQEQVRFEEQAAAQRQLIAGLDQQITELQTKAASIKVEVDISAAQAAVTQLQAQLNALNTQASASIPMQEGGGYAAGGYTGPGGKYKVAGVVHANEFVTRSEIVRQPGALEFLNRFNRIGIAALRGYATGGLVSPVAKSGANQAPLVLNLPNYGSYELQGAPDVLGELTTAIKRQALKRGGRR